MADVTHGFADLGEVRLHYVEAGAGPLVVFHHGFPSCWLSFNYQLADLAADHRVVSIDGLGANLSSKPDDLAPYRLERLVEQLDGVARHLAGDEPFSLIGHDWGGALAWAFAQRHPDRLRDVVAISAPPYNQLIELLRTNPDQRARSSYMWDLRDGDLHTLLTEEGGRRLWRWAYRPLRSLPHFDGAIDLQFRDALAMPGAVDGGIDWYRANVPPVDEIQAFEPWPSRSATVTVPGLLIWGDDDRTFVPEFIDALPDYVDDLRVCRLPDTGHWPMIERPAEVNRAIREFLGRSVTSSR